MGGKVTCRNIGRSGGLRGELERGVLRMNVRMRRWVSMSPRPEVVAVMSSEKVWERNLEGGEKRREWSMSMEGARPARALERAERIEWRDGSFQRFEGPIDGVGGSGNLGSEVRGLRGVVRGSFFFFLPSSGSPKALMATRRIEAKSTGSVCGPGFGCGIILRMADDESRRTSGGQEGDRSRVCRTSKWISE